MATTIDSLQIEIDASAKNAVSAIDKLQAQLDKVAGAMENITQGAGYQNLNNLTSSLRGLSSVTISQELPNSITNTAHAVAKFGNASVEKALTNMPKVVSGLKGMTASMKGTTFDVDLSSYDSVLKVVNRLGNSTATNATENIPKISQSLVAFVKDLNAIKVSDNAMGLNNLSSAISKLGNKAAARAIENLPKLTAELKKMVSVLSQASPQVAVTANALANFSSQGGKIASASKAINKSMSDTGKSANSFGAGLNGIASKIGLVYSSLFMLVRAFKGIGRAIKSSMDYIETYNYFDSAMGQVAERVEGDWEKAGYESAEKYIESFKEKYSQEATALTKILSGYIVNNDGSLTYSNEKNLGIDPNMLLNYQAQFAQMASSMNVASEYSMKLSDAMTRLSLDLGSVKNIEFDQVMDDASSAMVGMSRTVDKYGANIRNTNMQQKLLELGITANVTKLSQADKALLRTTILLDSSRFAWGDLSDTLSQPANQLRMIQSGLHNLSKELGDLFLGTVANILPYINALIIALNRLVEWIRNVLGIELPKYTGQSASAVADYIDDMDDGFESATGSAKKLKQQLLGIDELNVISSKDSGGSGSGPSLADSESIKSAFDKIYEEYLAKWEEAYKGVENKSQVFADNLVDIAKGTSGLIGKGFKSSFKADTADLEKNTKSIVKSIDKIFSDADLGDAATNFVDSFGQAVGAAYGAEASIGASIADGITGGVADSLDKNAPFIADKLTSVYNNLTDVNNTTIDLAGALAKVGKVFEGDSFKKIVEFFTDLYTVFDLTILDYVTGFFADLYSTISKPLIDNADKLRDVLDKVFNVIDNLLEPARELLVLFKDNSKNYEDTSFHGFMSEIAEYRSEKFSRLLDFLNDILDITIDLTEGYSLEQWTSPLGFLKDEFESWNIDAKQWFEDNIVKKFTETRFGSFLTEDMQNAFNDIKAIWDLGKEDFDIFISDLEVIFKYYFNPIADWFDENVINKIVDNANKFSDKFSEVYGAVTEKWGVFSDWFSENVVEPVSQAFTDIKDTMRLKFNEAWDNIKVTGINVANKIIGAFEDMINNIVGKLNDLIGKFNSTFENVPDFKSVKTIPTLNIPRIKGYANGGLVTPGELFVARENGPEMVGSFGNRTGVANNDQIVSGIEGGVERAVERALVPVLERILNATEECASKDGITEEGILNASLNAARTRSIATNRPVFNY